MTRPAKKSADQPKTNAVELEDERLDASSGGGGGFDEIVITLRKDPGETDARGGMKPIAFGN